MTLPTGLGAVLAIIVLVLAIVLAFVGQLAYPLAALFIMLAIARLT